MTNEQLTEFKNDIETAQTPDSKTIALNFLASNLQHLSRNDEAIIYANEALSLSRQIGDTEQEAQALMTLGHISKERGDQDVALEYYLQTKALCENSQNIKGIAAVTHNIGGVYSNLSDYPRALECYQNALEINEKIGHTQNASNNYSSIGTLYMHLSDYQKSLEYYNKALLSYEQASNISGIAHTLANIGNVYQYLSDFKSSLEYLFKALALPHEFVNKRALALITRNIGVAYFNFLDYSLALQYYYQALAMFEELNNKSGIAITLSCIGLVNADQANYKEALEVMHKALALEQEIGNKGNGGVNIANIAKVYAKKDFEGYDPQKAEESFLEVLELFEQIGRKQELYDCHYALSELYEQEKDIDRAFIHFKKYHLLKAEVQTEEATKQAQSIQYRLKIEESERDRQVNLARFQEQEKILNNILPVKIAERIISGEKTIAESFNNVSIFFSDIVDFTKLSQKIGAEDLVAILNAIFTEFDILARKHGVEKIKTIGDSYMAVCGVPEANSNHAVNVANFALDVQDAIRAFTSPLGDNITIRIGLHCGKVVAGIIGENKYSYDLWGDAVNTASRMESFGEAGKIHVSEEFMQACVGTGRVSAAELNFIPRGEMEIKGKGMMKTYFIEQVQ